MQLLLMAVKYYNCMNVSIPISNKNNAQTIFDVHNLISSPARFIKETKVFTLCKANIKYCIDLKELHVIMYWFYISFPSESR